MNNVTHCSAKQRLARRIMRAGFNLNSAPGEAAAVSYSSCAGGKSVVK
jgi:hypothetical protein